MLKFYGNALLYPVALSFRYDTLTVQLDQFNLDFDLILEGSPV